MRNARAPHESVGRILLTLYGVAVAVNYLWELAQSPLYVGMDRLSLVWWHCLLASLGDGFLVLLIYAAGSVALRSPYWFVSPDVKGYVLMLSAGLVIGIGVEWMALHFTRQWSYTSRMPLLPAPEVGIAPVIQMLVLPPLIFRLVIRRNRYDKNRVEDVIPRR